MDAQTGQPALEKKVSTISNSVVLRSFAISHSSLQQPACFHASLTTVLFLNTVSRRPPADGGEGGGGVGGGEGGVEGGCDGGGTDGGDEIQRQ